MQRLLPALLFLTLILAAAPTPASADESDFPSVTITSIVNKACCFDGVMVFNSNQPDFFVVVRLRNALGQDLKCDASPVSEDQVTPMPNVTLCNPIGAPGTSPITIRRPYSVIVELWDADGNPPSGSPVGTASTTELAQQADLAARVPPVRSRAELRECRPIRG